MSDDGEYLAEPATRGTVLAVEEAVRAVEEAVRESVVPRRERIATVVLASFAARGLYLEVGRVVQAADALIAELDKGCA